MKKLAVTLAIILSAMFLFSSCSKESGNYDKLIGTWEVTHNFEEGEWGEEDKIDNRVGDIYKFYENGSCLLKNKYLYCYAIDNDTLLVTGDRYTIEELTSSKLILERVPGNDICDAYFEFKRVR